MNKNTSSSNLHCSCNCFLASHCSCVCKECVLTRKIKLHWVAYFAFYTCCTLLRFANHFYFKYDLEMHTNKTDTSSCCMNHIFLRYLLALIIATVNMLLPTLVVLSKHFYNIRNYILKSTNFSFIEWWDYTSRNSTEAWEIRQSDKNQATSSYVALR